MEGGREGRKESWREGKEGGGEGGGGREGRKERWREGSREEGRSEGRREAGTGEYLLIQSPTFIWNRVFQSVCSCPQHRPCLSR